MSSAMRTHVDRCVDALERRGVRLQRSAVVEIVATTFGYDTSNHAIAAAKRGELDPPDAPLIDDVDPEELASFRDPVSGLAFSMAKSFLAPGRDTRQADYCVTPYGNLVSVVAARHFAVATAAAPTKDPAEVHAQDVGRGQDPDRRHSDLLKAVGDIGCAARLAVGRDGKPDLRIAYDIADALHNVGLIAETIGKPGQGLMEDVCTDLYRRFWNLPNDTHGRLGMLQAIEAYDDTGWSGPLRAAARSGELGRTFNANPYASNAV